MRLIINADDFGISNEINNNVLLLYKLGILSSATLISNSNCFNQAIEISKANPGLGVGVHLCLDGPFNIGKDYSTITNRHSNEFYPINVVEKKLARFALKESEIYKEYCLQVEKVLSENIEVSHLDHHHHLHRFLPVLRCMIKVARTYNISFIRPQVLFMHKHKNIINFMYRRFHQYYLKKALSTIDGYYEPKVNKGLSFELEYLRLSKIMNQKDKIIEIMLHPFNQDDVEMKFFTSRNVVKLLKEQEIINYKSINSNYKTTPKFH